MLIRLVDLFGRDIALRCPVAERSVRRRASAANRRGRRSAPSLPFSHLVNQPDKHRRNQLTKRSSTTDLPCGIMAAIPRGGPGWTPIKPKAEILKADKRLRAFFKS